MSGLNDPRTGMPTIRGKRTILKQQTLDYGLDNAFELFYNVKKAEGSVGFDNGAYRLEVALYPFERVHEQES